MTGCPARASVCSVHPPGAPNAGIASLPEGWDQSQGGTELLSASGQVREPCAAGPGRFGGGGGAKGEKGAAPGSAGGKRSLVWHRRARWKPQASRELGPASRTRNRRGSAVLGVSQVATWLRQWHLPPPHMHTRTHRPVGLGYLRPRRPGGGALLARHPKPKLLALPPPRQATAAATAGGATSTRVSEPFPPLRLNHVPTGVAETHLLSPPPLLCTLCLPCPADAGCAQSPPPLLLRQIQHEAPPTSLSHKHPAGPLYPYLTRWRPELTRSREVLLTVFDSQMRKPRPPGK